MAGVAFAVEGDGVGFATESYAASALYTTLASLSGALWRIRRARLPVVSMARERALLKPAGDFAPNVCYFEPSPIRRAQNGKP